ncbi:hypothetical protein [Oceanobacillus sp. CAU 1775]
MGVSKWDLFKLIEKLPDEKYAEIKSYLDKLINLEEAFLDKESKDELEKSLDEYEKGEYFTFDEVFGKGEE